MTDKRMSDKEIIKGLECCQTEYCRNCKECPYDKFKSHSISSVSCESRLREDLLHFVNRQNAEIDRLADRSHKCIYLSDEETTEYCVDGPCPKFKTEEQIRAEAVKEFAHQVVDLSNGGIIAAIDVVDLHAEYQKKLKVEG